MDVFAFPSHAEAFGLALIEAMSMGKPSVCSDSDGVLDIAVDGVTSFLFKKQDAADLKIKLEQLILSPVKRNEFGKAARTRAVEFFDNEVMLKKLIDLYNDDISRLAVDVNK
jgi:glycosyltransferase involved in cell wall biosynthesis